MKIVIIGAGLIGRERIEAVQHISKSHDVSIAAIFDTSPELLAKANQKYNVPTVSSLNDALALDPDWVFIATPNDVVAEIARQAFQVGANVLVEKPFGRTLAECDNMIELKPINLKLNVGFNYRFFAGIEAALRDAKAGKFGKLISVNTVLAHGNSPGMEKSWKLDPVRCGNVVTDLGVHTFDLALQLATGSIDIQFAKAWRGFWNTGIDEESHMILVDDAGTIFNTQVSLNRWRSTFKLEINGTEGYGVVDARGRSYGPQSYRTGVRWGWQSGKNQADTETIVIDKNDCSDSFIKETAAVLGFSADKACSHEGARDIMMLLQRYEDLIQSDNNTLTQ